MLNEQFKEPEEEFIKFFAARAYDGVLTPKVKQQFTEITKKALRQFLSDSINDRLKSAIGGEQTSKVDEDVQHAQDDDKPKIITTNDEVEGFNIVKAILRQKVDATRIIARDTQSYFGVLLDDNNRKPLCRLHFNAKQKYLGLFDVDKNETRHPIETIDQIFDFSEILLQTTTYYE